MRGWGSSAAGVAIALLPATLSASTQSGSLTVSVFVADTPGSCHAWPVPGERGATDVTIGVRCSGPAPYSISLAQAVVAPQGAADAGRAASPALPDGTAAPEQGMRTAICGAGFQDCTGLHAAIDEPDGSVIKISIVY